MTIEEAKELNVKHKIGERQLSRLVFYNRFPSKVSIDSKRNPIIAQIEMNWKNLEVVAFNNRGWDSYEIGDTVIFEHWNGSSIDTQGANNIEWLSCQTPWESARSFHEDRQCSKIA